MKKKSALIVDQTEPRKKEKIAESNVINVTPAGENSGTKVGLRN